MAVEKGSTLVCSFGLAITILIAAQMLERRKWREIRRREKKGKNRNW